VNTIDKKGAKITFTKKFIDKHKDKLLSNYKNLVIFFIFVESGGDPFAKHGISSAR